VVEFEYLKPQNLINYTGLNTKIEDVLKIESSQIIESNLKNSGIQSDSIVVNIIQYLFIIFAAIILVAILASLYTIPYIREKIKELII